MEIDVKVISKSKVWGMDLLMILVSLGTQDRSFKRLLDAVEKQIRLGNITEKVIVQAGETHYVSDCMEVFDLIPSEEFSKLLQECRILITHGGVGTIIEGLKHHKKIIAAARLSEYGEHQNNHQKQIISEFSKRHFLLELDDFESLDNVLEKIQKFEPAEYESNTESFISILDSYIEKELKDGKGNQKRLLFLYLFYGIFAIFFQGIFFSIFAHFSSNILLCTCCFQLFLIGLRTFFYHHFFSNKSVDIKEEAFFLFLLTIQVLFVFFYPSFFAVGFLWKLCGFSFLNVLLTYFFAVIFLHQE